MKKATAICLFVFFASLLLELSSADSSSRPANCVYLYTLQKNTKALGLATRLEPELQHTLDTCRQACIANPSCLNVNFGHNDASCWIGTTANPSTQPDTNYDFLTLAPYCRNISAPATPLPSVPRKIQDGCVYLYTMRLNSNGYGAETRINAPLVSTRQQCEQACTNYAPCTYITMGHNDHSCYIGTGTPNPTNNTNYDFETLQTYCHNVSAPETPLPNITRQQNPNCVMNYSVQLNTRGYGAETRIRAPLVNTMASCQQTCTNYGPCTFVVWGHNDKSCWIGTDYSPVVKNNTNYDYATMPTVCYNPKPLPACQNGGTPTYDSNGNGVCNCTAAYYGSLCQNQMPQCQNGGSAVLGSNGTYTCQCSSGFSGSNCQFTIPQCQNGGSLVQAADGSYSCNCTSGFSGANCQTPICQNGGTPSNGICICTLQFYGKNCQIAAPAGYVALQDSNYNAVGLYWFSTTTDTWDNWSKSCNAQLSGAYLAVIQNAAQDNAIKAYIRTFSSAAINQCATQYATAGQRDTINNCTPGVINYNFYWKPYGQTQTAIVQGQSYTGWLNTQPDCGTYNGENESCIAYWLTGSNLGWNDYRCISQPTCSICQYNMQQF